MRRLRMVQRFAPRPGRLLRTVECLSVQNIVLTFDRRNYAVIAADIAGEPFEDFPTSVAELARMDGFKDAAETCYARAGP